MKKYILGMAAVVALASASVLTVNATQEPTSIGSCASLLPAGYDLQLSIIGKIDTNNKQRKFDGNFSLSDGTEKQNPELQKKVMPFVECVKPLLR